MQEPLEIKKTFNYKGKEYVDLAAMSTISGVKEYIIIGLARKSKIPWIKVGTKYFFPPEKTAEVLETIRIKENLDGF